MLTTLLSSVFAGQLEVVTLMTRLYPRRRTSTTSGPMTESTWAPLLVYPKAKVQFYIDSIICRLEYLPDVSLSVLLCFLLRKERQWRWRNFL